MALSLKQTAFAIAQGLVANFQGVGGTPPYTYAVLPDGPGGTILPGVGTSADYTSPQFTGQEVIQVTDSLNATATAKILVCTPLELVCEIIQRQMYLDDGRVYLWDQKINQPKDEKIYIAIGVLMTKPIANRSSFNGSGPGLVEEQVVNMYANLSIDIISKGPDARDRKEEVIMALKSSYSQQQQLANGFYLAPISNAFVNLSHVDGAAIPYRFNISAAIQYSVTKSRAVDYYDDFAEAEITIEP